MRVALRAAAFRGDSGNETHKQAQAPLKHGHTETAGLLGARHPTITERKSLQDNCSAAPR